MDKKLFKSLLLLFAICIFMVAFVVKIDWFIAFLRTVLSLLSPLFIGLIIALTINPLYEFFVRLFQGKVKFRFGKKSKQAVEEREPDVEQKSIKIVKGKEKTKEEPKKKIRKELIIRILAIITSYIFLIAIIVVILVMFIPQIVSSGKMFAENFNGYLENLEALFDKVANFVGIEETLFSSIEKLLLELAENFSAIAVGIVPQIFDFTKILASSVLNFTIGFIMSIYMLAGKKKLVSQLKTVAHAFFPEKFYKSAADTTKLIVKTFSSFISSRIVDSVIVGVICFICMYLFRFDYPLLISVIVGVTNIIPVFGPFLGAIPSAFVLLMVEPMQAVWFCVFVLILQQIDGNVISPMVTGDAVGLPALWSMLAIFVGGGLFGIVGMLVGVPIFAVIYVLAQRETQRRLRLKNVIR